MRTALLAILLASAVHAQGVLIDRIDPRVPDPKEIRINRNVLLCWSVPRTPRTCWFYVFASAVRFVP